MSRRASQLEWRVHVTAASLDGAVGPAAVADDDLASLDLDGLHPAGATSSARIVRMNRSLKTHLPWRQLGQAVRVGDVLMDEQPAPASLDGVEVLAVEWNARAGDLHVARPVAPQRAGRGRRGRRAWPPAPLLLEQELHQLGIGRELEASGPTTFSKK